MKIIDFLKDKKIAILGFGREGKSSFNFIRNYLPDKHLAIHDKNFIDLNDTNTTIISGENYLQNLNDYNLILKTPGISFAHLNYYIEPEKISSQTALFLQYYAKQTIGITGTKGKSTTSSLIYHMLKQNHKKAVLAGNIGTPFFDIIDEIDEQTFVVAELSAHQLEFVHYSPHIAIMLNLYQEHLDYFNSFSSYVHAKMNITKYQTENDILIYNEDDAQISKQIIQHNFVREFYPFSNHDKNNAAITTCKLLGISDKDIEIALTSFVPLEHRQEFVGEKHGIRFYNDSIATVPEATIYALETLKDVDTLLLGGFDRGIDYTVLYDYLDKNPVENIVFMGPAGERMRTEWEGRRTQMTRMPQMNADNSLKINCIEENDMQKIIRFVIMHTQKGKICLLSPAAASYDQYTNFEERGKKFKQCVLQPFSLKSFNSFKIEVLCNDFICINKEEEFDYLFDKKIFETPFFILGGGYNILFTKDFNGTIIHINTKGIKIVNETKDFVDIKVKSGENWDDFIDFCVKNRFFGVENLAGIPGKVGSCPVQNIGAYGVEVKDVIKEVHLREIATGKLLVFSNEACKFGYRDSVFKNELKNKHIITSVVFQLSKIENYNLTYKALKDELQIYPDITLALVQEKIKEIRNRKLPDVEQIGSAGSFFKNPVILREKFEKLQQKCPQLVHFYEDENHVKLAAAQLIEISGWKGFRGGDAGVYPFQPLVLVNYGNATAQEIADLAEKIQQSVFEHFEVNLECEVQWI
ncbi:MAG: UDP-N-acetylmuramate dehydrogenase [Bacteroidetes bacterium]|nr:UDP-N-acetylmuramate dehydrogenase [Bacteroidota bacterium]MCL2301849.1 UDP-N-acetylmuramate dehydrogenase [Lentimicrobiaceae bacterium]